MNVAELLAFQPERGAKRKKEDQEDQVSINTKKRPMTVDRPTGSGLSEEERLKILEMVENEPEVEALDVGSLKRMLLLFEKKVTKNQEMRIKYPENPEKFMDSELDLNDEIQKLHVIATVPHLYQNIVDVNAVGTILGLLSHENSDVSIAIIDLLQEMTDVDTLNESEEGATALIDALLDEQVVALLAQNLDRLDENVKEDSDGVHNTLGIIENMTELRPTVCQVAGEQGMLGWLLRRLKQKPPYDANKLYCSEILSILLQSTEENRQLLGELNGIDTLLQCLSLYKRYDPTSSDELEFMENLFNCLCSSLMHNANKDLFLKGEGLQLMILMLREKKLSRRSSLKVLDYAMQGAEGAENCSKFIEFLGLRSLFPLFMKPFKNSKKVGSSEEETEEHTCSIIMWLFRNLSGNLKSRLVQKFVENDHLKVDRLMELHMKYHNKIQECDAKIEREKQELQDEGEEVDEALEDEFYMRRLDAGLFTLQLIDCIIMEVCCSGVSSVITVQNESSGFVCLEFWSFVGILTRRRLHILRFLFSFFGEKKLGDERNFHWALIFYNLLLKQPNIDKEGEKFTKVLINRCYADGSYTIKNEKLEVRYDSLVKVSYYSAMTPFYHIKATERAKYTTVSQSRTGQNYARKVEQRSGRTKRSKL